MAPGLPAFELHLVRDIVESQSVSTSQVAEEAECSKLSDSTLTSCPLVSPENGTPEFWKLTIRNRHLQFGRYPHKGGDQR